MVRLATCLTGWINSFWLPLSSVTVFVVDVAKIFGVVVWDRVIGVTDSISRIILIVFSLSFRCFQQATLVSITSWFFTVVACWFGSVSFSVCELLAHSFYL